MKTYKESFIKEGHFYRLKKRYSYLEVGRVYYSSQDGYLHVEENPDGFEYVGDGDGCFEEVRYKDVEKGKWYECRKTHDGFQEGESYYCDENGYLNIKKPISVLDSFNFSEILDWE